MWKGQTKKKIWEREGERRIKGRKGRGERRKEEEREKGRDKEKMEKGIESQRKRDGNKRKRGGGRGFRGSGCGQWPWSQALAQPIVPSASHLQAHSSFFMAVHHSPVHTREDPNPHVLLLFLLLLSYWLEKIKIVEQLLYYFSQKNNIIRRQASVNILKCRTKHLTCLNFSEASQLLIWLYFQMWVSMTSVDTEISCHTHRHIRSHVNGTSSLLLGVFWYTQFYTHKYIAE